MIQPYSLWQQFLPPERKVNITTTTPTAMVGAYGFKIANELTKAAHRL
jgi:hypothetical protein